MEQNFRNHMNQAELADIQTVTVDPSLSKEDRIPHGPLLPIRLSL